MFETIINLKPEREWRQGMTVDKLIAEMDQALQFPGVSNAWTMPIKARIDMLATGIRTPVGVKVYRHRSGRDWNGSPARSRRRCERCPGTTSAFAERIIGGYYLDIDPDRAQLARYGLMIGDVQDMIATRARRRAVTTTVEGRERYAVSIRYPRELRSDPQAIATRGADSAAQRRLRPARPSGQGRAGQGPGHHPHRERAARRLHLSSICATAISAATSPTRRRRWRHRSSSRPAITSPGAASSNTSSAPRRACKIVVPVTLLIIFLLLYLNFRRVTETLIVMLSLPFALVGGLWLMWWLGFNMSVAVAVGFIALAGVAAETGVVMLIYLDNALTELQAQARGRRRTFTRDDLYAAIMEGAVERVRPKMMTVAAIMAGLLPILWSTRHRRRGDAAHRRADDRRHGVVDGADAGRHSGDLAAVVKGFANDEVNFDGSCCCARLGRGNVRCRCS